MINFALTCVRLNIMLCWLKGLTSCWRLFTVMVCAAQPVGAPEISKKSISSCSTRGGDELFIIGKNFMKGTVVVFEEVNDDQVVWSSEADIDLDFFQAVSQCWLYGKLHGILAWGSRLVVMALDLWSTGHVFDVLLFRFDIVTVDRLFAISELLSTGSVDCNVIYYLSSGGVLAWSSVWCEVQTCVWPSWCHCHSLSLACSNFKIGFTFLVLSHLGSPRRRAVKHV